MAFKLRELEEELGEIIESISAGKEMILVEQDEDFQIWRDQGCVRILDLNIDAYSALSYVYDPNTKDFEVNSSLYILYKHGTNEEIYCEFGSSFPVCVYNYMHFIGKKELHEMEIVENLDCIFLLNGKEDWNIRQ